jgi:hypothetical protein
LTLDPSRKKGEPQADSGEEATHKKKEFEQGEPTTKKARVESTLSSCASRQDVTIKKWSRSWNTKAKRP